MEMSKNALSPHVKESEKKILDPYPDPDQNVKETLKAESEHLCSVNILSKSVQYFLSYNTRQITNRQTNRQTEPINILDKIISSSNKPTQLQDPHFPFGGESN